MKMVVGAIFVVLGLELGMTFINLEFKSHLKSLSHFLLDRYFEK